jgi:predicted nucleotidyltransferase
MNRAAASTLTFGCFLTLKMNITPYLEAFISWATAQADIEGVALVGSYARGAATEDSDVDLMILTFERAKYLENQDWLSLFGEIEQSTNETWGAVKTIRATYKTSPEIEYNFSTPSWAAIPVDAGTRRVVNDGMKILFDPTGILDALRNAVFVEGSAIA